MDETTAIVATAEIDIAAPPDRVWQALTDPEQIKQYMFGSTVESDWRPGSRITWSGEYNGQPYQDTGEIISADPPTDLELTHASGGDPANAHRLNYALTPTDGGTHLTLTQDRQRRPRGRRPRHPELADDARGAQAGGRGPMSRRKARDFVPSAPLTLTWHDTPGG